MFRPASRPGPPVRTEPPSLDVPAARVDRRAFATLAGGVRLQVLEALTSRPLSVGELARTLRRHRATVQYHLGFLLREGLVEEVPSVPSRKIGRPAVLYRASRHGVVPGFPRRHYEILADVALRLVVEELGPKKAAALLRARGVEIGQGMLGSVASKAQVSEWTPDSFQRHFIGDAMAQFGVATEVLSCTSRRIEFRAFSCPFLEAAEAMPDIVCDALDEGFHEGIDRGLGRVRTERITCMGHGAAYCEYRMTWLARSHGKKSKEAVSNG